MPTLPSPLITLDGVELLFNPVPVTNSNLPLVPAPLSVLVLNIATYFITRWSNAKFRTSGHCASWISRDDVVVLLCPFFRMARSVYPLVRSLKLVLACPKWNVDYFHDWLKWSSFENGVVWISVYASTEFGFMYHLKKVIYYMTYDAYLPFLGILSLEVGFIFSSHVLILADYNLLSFPDILVNILFEEVSFLHCLNIPKSNLVH